MQSLRVHKRILDGRSSLVNFSNRYHDRNIFFMSILKNKQFKYNLLYISLKITKKERDIYEDLKLNEIYIYIIISIVIILRIALL